MMTLLRPRTVLRPMAVKFITNNGRGASFSTNAPLFTPDGDEIKCMLSKPSWSVRSLLPQMADTAKSRKEISPEQLSHLLRLSALPQPTDESEQNEMLDVLQAQIHFVKEIQKVDTVHVTPLVALRDESPAALAESTIGLDDLKDAFAQEKPVGRNGRIKRQRTQKVPTPTAETWNPLEMASKTAGRYFVVQKKKKDRGTAKE